jgi:hypothetical protein
MPRVPRELIDHELHVDPNAKPIKQHLRCFTKDKKDEIKREIAKLLYIGFIKEVYHPYWLANPILVPNLSLYVKSPPRWSCSICIYSSRTIVVYDNNLE